MLRPTQAVLMYPEEILDVKSACNLTGKSDKTIRRWCNRFGIARQSMASAPLEISAPALMLVLYGCHDALERLRIGDRSHPDTVRMLSHLGLSQ